MEGAMRRTSAVRFESARAVRWGAPGRKIRLLLLTISLAVGGCQQADSSPTNRDMASAITAPLNASPEIGDFVILAQRSIRLQTGGNFNGGDIGASGTGSGAAFLSGGVALDVNSGVSVQASQNLLSDSIRLGT